MSLAIGVELGGTKVVVAGSSGGTTLIGRTRIDTHAPEPTLAAVRRTIGEITARGPVTSIGIGTFGPVDLRTGSERFGTIISTPKPVWSGVDLIEGIAGGLGVPVAIDTDVNAALLAEVRWGAAADHPSAYLTIGTGIGGAIWSDGGILHGANHSEIGHLPLPPRPDDPFPGRCPYHGACLEGLASGPALADRFGSSLEDLGPSDRARAVDLAGHYVGLGVLALTTVVPVQTVVIGGGVAHLPGFHDAVASTMRAAANGYPPVPYEDGGPEIVAPGLGDDAGVVGCIELGRSARFGGSGSG